MIETIGIDWKSASVSERERCALAGEDAAVFMAKAQEIDGISGCVLLKTCGRFEAYLDVDDMSANPDSRKRALAMLAGIDPDASSIVHVQGEDSCRRLMEIASGLQSQVLGEEQIIAQVKSAIAQAREAGTATPHLETLFRLAVTAGKEVRTKVRFQTVPTSCAHKAIEKAERTAGKAEADAADGESGSCAGAAPLKGKRALVIGNGEMGRLIAALLVKKGCSVAVTLRTFHHGGTIVPQGCSTASYEDRAEAMEGCDIIVSATRSPHMTVSREMIEGLEKRPSIMIDLALPRDIDPKCRELDGVALFDIDDLVDERPGDDTEEMCHAREIILERMRDYDDWSRKRSERIDRAREEGRDPEGAPTMRFPLFVDLAGKKCLVVGAGKIGRRRAEALRDSGADVRVVAKECPSQIEGVDLSLRGFEKSDVTGCTIVVAATNDSAVNAEVAEAARETGALVNVSDNRHSCDFFFPAICRSENLVAGIVSDGGRHRLVSQAARAIRETMIEVDS